MELQVVDLEHAAEQVRRNEIATLRNALRSIEGIALVMEDRSPANQWSKTILLLARAALHGTNPDVP